jgi:hypothetical protein
MIWADESKFFAAMDRLDAFLLQETLEQRGNDLRLHSAEAAVARPSCTGSMMGNAGTSAMVCCERARAFNGGERCRPFTPSVLASVRGVLHTLHITRGTSSPDGSFAMMS